MGYARPIVNNLARFAVVVLVAGSGCNTVQKNPPPPPTVEADATTLMEFARTCGQELAADFKSLPEISASGTKVIIEIGSIKNSTRTPASDFAQVQRRVVLTLASSPYVRENAIVVEKRERVQNDAAKVAAPPTLDVLGRDVQSSPSGEMKQYMLEDTYFLNGTFSEMVRGAQSTFQFDVTLTNAASRAIIYTKLFDSQQTMK